MARVVWILCFISFKYHRWIFAMNLEPVPKGYKSCTISGDPVIETFDGGKYVVIPPPDPKNMMRYKYMLSKEFNATLVPFPCNFNLAVTLHRLPDRDVFSSEVITFSGSIGFFASFEIATGKNVKIGGVTVTLPCDKCRGYNVTVLEENGYVVIKPLDINACPLRIFYDGRGSGGIQLGSVPYARSLEALCGNFNGDKSDDILPRHTIEPIPNIPPHANTFSASWVVGKS